MEFGARSAFDGQSALVPEATLRLAWFERSSAEGRALDRGGVEGSTLLDRVREGEGLVYNGEGEYEF